MTSQISTYSGNINATFPVAGQDNDSQGFRDNFASIKSALTEANTEVSALQTVVVTTADLATQSTPVTNNFQNSVISNAGFTKLSGVFYGPNTHVTTNTNVDLSNGPIQKFIIAGNVTLTFTDWPSNSNYLNATYSTVRVMLYGDQLNSYTVTLSTANSGTLVPATGWTTLSGTSTFASGGTVGSTTITLSSVTGFAAGQLISGTGILPNTYIVSISGSVVTISDPLYAQGAGTYNSYSFSVASPVTVTVGNTSKYEVIEAWTVNGGTTVYLKNVGEFTGP